MPWRVQTLWVYAAPAEGEAIAAAIGPQRSLAVGVGKAAAAHALTVALVQGGVGRVVSVGVCGVHRAAGLAVGQSCVVGDERFVDEGVATPGGFLDLRALGLGPAGPLRADADAVRGAAAILGAPVLGGGTVSTCSGTDGLALERVSRHPDAQIETMEGAAIALCCARLGVPWVGVRTISNFTGDRERAGWDLPAALAELGRACGRLHAAGW
jgi:futalosine hydrolase